MQAAPEAPEEAADPYIEALEAEIERLRADIRYLKLEREHYESLGFSRGRRRMLLPRAGTIAPKPVVPAIDIPPVEAQLKDE
jgi:hypothetical protein